MKKQHLELVKNFLIWFSLFYLLFWGFSLWKGKEAEKTAVKTGIELQWVDKSPVSGQLVQLNVLNHTNETVTWSSPCIDNSNLRVNRRISGKDFAVSVPDCKSSNTLTLPAGESAIIAFPEINNALWKEAGNYEATLLFKKGESEETVKTEPIEIESAGFVRRGFRSIITQPLFNLLVFFLNYIPGHPLGWAIILVTLAVRLFLFPWNQTAMRSQRKLQKMQPEMEAMRKKHGKNQQALAMKTMELYKKHKINPMSSCWPMLLQMPFLIGLYLVVKDGLSPHQTHLIYDWITDYVVGGSFDLSLVNHHFLGLDLKVPNILVLPVLVGVAQFIAIKLSMIAAKKKTSDKKITKKKSEGMQGQMEQMQGMMLWGMPVMIAVFTATFPAAVGIYWLTSTVFGIGQQKFVNWQLDKPQVRRKS